MRVSLSLREVLVRWLLGAAYDYLQGLPELREAAKEGPKLCEEAARLGCAAEGMYDLHIIRAPITEETYNAAYLNAQETASDVAAGRLSLEGRAISLSEILKRQRLI
jgi:hypothetical protein